MVDKDWEKEEGCRTSGMALGRDDKKLKLAV